MNIEERLNALLNEKENEVQNLRSEIERFKWQFDLSRLNWQMHQYFEEDNFSSQMPYPRLEMRLRRLSSNDTWYQVEYIYGLVYKHYADATTNTLLFIPFSITTLNRSNGKFESLLDNGVLETPLRDGVHILAESQLFGLPAYIVCKEKNICQKIDVRMDLSKQLSQMRS